MNLFYFCLLLAFLVVTACTHMPKSNDKLTRYDATAGYRFKAVPSPGNSDSLFFVLSLSGGGTRAAALAYGTLEHLARTQIEWEGQRRRLLDEVDVISSVSGGSVTAAYFGLQETRCFPTSSGAFSNAMSNPS